jgi:hypothetical protein
MNKYPLSLYLLPFILLLIVIVFIKGGSDLISGKNRGGATNDKKTVTNENKSPDTSNGESGTGSQLPFESRIPVYPGAEKIALLEEGVDVKESAFFTTTDPIDSVRDWYIEKLGGFEKINMIDIVNKDELRVITISLPDPPKELVEIKEKFKGAKDLLITITTVSFYTRNQPRPYEPEKEEGKESSGEKGDV